MRNWILQNHAINTKFIECKQRTIQQNWNIKIRTFHRLRSLDQIRMRHEHLLVFLLPRHKSKIRALIDQNLTLSYWIRTLEMKTKHSQAPVYFLNLAKFKPKILCDQNWPYKQRNRNSTMNRDAAKRNLKKKKRKTRKKHTHTNIDAHTQRSVDDMEKKLVCTSIGGGVIIVIDGESWTVWSNESDRRNVKNWRRNSEKESQAEGLWKKGGDTPEGTGSEKSLWVLLRGWVGYVGYSIKISGAFWERCWWRLPRCVSVRWQFHWVHKDHKEHATYNDWGWRMFNHVTWRLREVTCVYMDKISPKLHSM